MAEYLNGRSERKAGREGESHAVIYGQAGQTRVTARYGGKTSKIDPRKSGRRPRGRRVRNTCPGKVRRLRNTRADYSGGFATTEREKRKEQTLSSLLHRVVVVDAPISPLCPVPLMRHAENRKPDHVTRWWWWWWWSWARARTPLADETFFIDARHAFPAAPSPFGGLAVRGIASARKRSRKPPVGRGGEVGRSAPRARPLDQRHDEESRAIRQ